MLCLRPSTLCDLRLACLGALLTWLSANVFAADAPRPNILWIIAEDMGPEIGCYGEPLVHTPNIDSLAKDGIRYTNVYCTAPVCSAARSALMTGMYQTTIGAHNHRSHRTDDYPLPEGVQLLTQRFRDAGYFTANITTGPDGMKGTGKTDWNFTYKRAPFDGSRWEDLKKHQPFFAQINFSETHRGFKHSDEHPVDPAKVVIPPYYPDHPVTREDWALYLETVNVLDTHVAKVLAALKADQLDENTIVFFFADHGHCHVRGKQWLYDGGIHIPLLVRFPDHRDAGTVNEDLIAHIDIAASSLSLAGIALPAGLESQPFLGPAKEKFPAREFVISARDRCDETVDRIRSVRTKQYKYIRNFYPERPYTQLNRYKESQYPVLPLMRRLHEAGLLKPEQELFMAPRRPTEELYDVTSDPHEIHNLVASPEHRDVLVDLRGKLDQWITQTGDQGRIPEDPKVLEAWQRTAAEKSAASKKK